MAFQPGKSGNPGGMSTIGNAKSLAKSLSKDALTVLASIQSDTSAPVEIRVDAAKSILTFSGLSAQQ
jgi:hypothetical protein